MNISVILCSHNPRRDYLARCLDGLRGQTLEANRWELLLIDNRSETPIASMADLSWCRSARLVREHALGLTAARLRGIRISTGELLVFVDDDNILDADFLETAIAVARERPFLGSWSGQCRPEFERQPPEWTRRYWGNLVIREFETDCWSNLPRLPETMPCGAGLCVRREVAARYLALHESGHRWLALDRMGGELLSGGDNDLAACACDIGLGVGLVSALKLTHLIPLERLTADYLARLIHGISFSSTLIDGMRGARPVPRGMVGRVADTLRRWRTGSPHRRILGAAQDGRKRALDLIAVTRTGSPSEMGGGERAVSALHRSPQPRAAEADHES